MKAARILRPSSVRIGMFCRLGSTEDSRPVVVAASENDVWTRPDLRIDVAGQRVGIGRLQLGDLPPFDDPARQLVALLGEVLEGGGRGRPLARRGLLAAGQLHLSEQDVPELLGRADIERLAGELMDLGLEPGGALGEFAGEACQDLPVDGDPACLHAGQDRRQGSLQAFIDRGHAFGHEALPEDPP